MSDDIDIRAQRPLSPHLQVYRPQITSVLSILHRITGVVLAAGLVPLVLWLWSVAYDLEMYECISRFFSAWYGKLALIGWTAAFYYHMANGVRHLFWDTGVGFSKGAVVKTGIWVLLFTVLATIGTWYYICFVVA